VSAPGASHLLEAVFVGLVIGAVAAIPAHLLLCARNLRWTWALIPTAAGALAVWASLVETWSVALLIGGACTARWAYLRERRDRESGGDARRRARQAIGVGDALARRRAKRELRSGPLVKDHGFLLGMDRKGLPVRLRFGGGSGRHGLLLGAATTFRRENGEWKIVDRHADPISTDDRKLHEMAPDNWDEAEADVASLSAHIDDPTDSGRGEVADPLGPFISTTAEAPRRFGQRRAHGETRRLTQLISRRLRQTTGYGRG
jgi:hypothetical protein